MRLDVVIGIFVWLLGLCVGSFLNVVVYRLTTGLSIGSPARSFCPQCGQPIAWYDNIPLLSWLLLGAHCRRCQGPISVQYPLVEALTGLAFVLIYYLLFVADARAGIGELAHPVDWPLLLAWLVLAAVLIACGAMDIVSYMLDVRVTYVALAAGIALHAAWPRGHLLASQAATPLAAGAVAAFLVSLGMLWLTVWRVEDDEPASAQTEDTDGPPASASTAAALAGRLAVAVFVGLSLWLLGETALSELPARDLSRVLLPENVEVNDATGRSRGHGFAPDVVVPATLLAVFAATVLIGGRAREADAEVTAAIEGERSQARKIALREVGWLAPSIVAGAIAYAAVTRVPAVGSAWQAATGWSPGGGFCPVSGAAFAACGATVGAAAGWMLRIVFTFVFGREAFGVGDIYILGAAGAALGWDMALLGLLLAVGVALAGFALSLLLKRSVIIPFGPWLGIGFVGALWLNRPAADITREYFSAIVEVWSQRPDICLVAGGLMLIGAAVAVVLARLTRRLVEPADAGE